MARDVMMPLSPSAKADEQSGARMHGMMGATSEYLDPRFRAGMSEESVCVAAHVLIALLFPTMARADTVPLYAAGSLRGALDRRRQGLSKPRAGNKVEAKFGPSGLLKNEIAGGAKAEVFASANMEHPQALHDAGKSGPVVLLRAQQDCARWSSRC